MSAIQLAEKGILPDFLIRAGIRRLLRDRLAQEVASDPGAAAKKVNEFVHFLSTSPIAVETEAANEQHYEVPPGFFEIVLGPRLKYSSCLWGERARTLADAEEEMLETTSQRAEIESGQSILDLGCGWGSFSLWAAERFPGVRITAVSNSSTQREFILAKAQERGLQGIEVETRDMNDFSIEKRFDRIVSVEMLEHLRNYGEFFSRVKQWLAPNGKFFVHIFCHRSMPYAFEPVSADDWMARHFFSGGIMPSQDLFRHFDRDLEVQAQWEVNGLHYSKTLEAWLRNQDNRPGEILSLFSETYGRDQAKLWFQRWRIFFMACSELFRFNGGAEWLVAHYLLRSR
ncbi:MAG: class I SAM-dependent methyltransferase [Candidatus Omnitrophica bacterium]|nr:class I SAM-dependent methyltransferase [Candidatus Omnitrophota bacterium]